MNDLPSIQNDIVKTPGAGLAKDQGSIRRNSIFFRAGATRMATAALALQVLCASGISQPPSNFNWITGPPADNLWTLMGQSPYAQNGDRGTVIYMITYSSCPNCIAFLRDFWQSRRDEIELREVFAPVNSQAHFLDEAADVALTRDPAIVDAYYHRTRTAPPANTPARRAALSRAELFMTQANSSFAKIGHVRDGFPTFILRVHEDGMDKVLIISGWGSPELTRDMDRWVKAGK
jgi:hypothetical protein